MAIGYALRLLAVAVSQWPLGGLWLTSVSGLVRSILYFLELVCVVYVCVRYVIVASVL